jgi:flagellin-like protein
MVARRGTGDDRGVSPVIGIVLVVAITVVLVGVTAVYLTDVGGETDQPAPRLLVDTDYNGTFAGNGQYLTLTHESGEKIATDSIHLDIEDAKVRSGGSTTGPAEYDGNAIQTQAGSEFTASETVSIDRTLFVDGSGNALSGSEYVMLDGATVRIVWESEDGTRSEIIYSCVIEEKNCIER